MPLNRLSNNRLGFPYGGGKRPHSQLSLRQQFDDDGVAARDAHGSAHGRRYHELAPLDDLDRLSQRDLQAIYSQ